MPMFMSIFLKRLEEENCEPWEEAQKEAAMDLLRELQRLADTYHPPASVWHTCLEIMEQSRGAADARLWFQIMGYLKYEIVRKH